MQITINIDIEQLEHKRLSISELNSKLSSLFYENINVEEETRDINNGDDFCFLFEVKHPVLHGFGRIEYLKTNDINVFYITNVEFELEMI